MEANTSANKESKIKAGDYTDPTYNVLQLVEAAVRRQDDLRHAELTGNNSIIAIHFSYIEKIRELESKYSDKLRDLESKRLDSIRTIDANAVSVAAQQAAAKALVLENQVNTSAEALRTLVASTATNIAKQFSDLTTQFTTRLATLEKAQYEAQGAGIPTILISRIEQLEKNRSESTGKTSGYTQLLGWILFAMAIMGFLISRFGTVVR